MDVVEAIILREPWEVQPRLVELNLPKNKLLQVRDLATDRPLVQVECLGQPLGQPQRVGRAAHPGEVARFRGGETKLLAFFVGQVMKRSKGKADPKGVQPVLTEKLRQR